MKSSTGNPFTEVALLSGLFSLSYLLFFTKHGGHSTHSFVFQHLSPFIAMATVTTMAIVCSRFFSLRTSSVLISATCLLLVAFPLSIQYLKTPYAPLLLECAKEFGSAANQYADRSDLVLTNQPERTFQYYINIPRYTARRTIQFGINEIEEVNKYRNDDHFKGIIYIHWPKDTFGKSHCGRSCCRFPEGYTTACRNRTSQSIPAEIKNLIIFSDESPLPTSQQRASANF